MHLLHLVGATNTRFYHDLSCTYHDATITPDGMTYDILRVSPTGDLFLREFNDEAERPTNLSEVADLADHIDLVAPFMFCPNGMTVWREMFETMFNIPVVGPPLSTTVASTSKWHTKAIAKISGVRTPDAVRVNLKDVVPAWNGTCIVKPDQEDNSIGLSLVTEKAQLSAAIETALSYGDTALVEQYIPGREIRVGVIDSDGMPRVLPILEYHVSDAHPIRSSADKVDVDNTGKVTRKSWDQPTLDTSCPADMSDDLQRRVGDMALTMHRAMQGRDYSLFDMRINTDTHEVFMLEACSFWTFAPISVISKMVVAENRDLSTVVEQVFRNAAERDQRDR